MQLLDCLDKLPQDPILGITQKFLKDSRAEKVNLGVGIYSNEEGVLDSFLAVEEAEKKLADHMPSKAYLPIRGLGDFLEALRSDIFYEEVSDRIASMQTLGGTGALYLGAKLLLKAGYKEIAASHPTWVNHNHIFTSAGFSYHSCPYFDRSTQSLLFKEYLKSLEDLENGCVVLLHACCHNPTGVDLSEDQWDQLSKLIKRKEHIPFFDAAYLGFSKDFIADAYPIRLFSQDGHTFLLGLSLSKSLGLYNERVGALYIVTANKKIKGSVQSQVERIARGIYSNPPGHGAYLVDVILKNLKLKSLWHKELLEMCQRLVKQRTELAFDLERAVGGSFSYLIDQKGLFSFLPLNKEQVDRLQSLYGIYMPESARINIAAINPKNQKYIVQAICDATQ